MSDGVLLVPGITLKEEGFLIIQRVKKEDEGMYECRASNDKGAVASTAMVRVLGETLVTLTTETVKKA